MDTVRADFDRIARFDTPEWDHNRHYHPFLLRTLAPHLGEALEIGCGQGDFARLLADRSDHVLAIDLSPEMVRRAHEKSAQYSNIHYQVADVMDWEWSTNRFDCIASIATLHHLPLEEMLIRMKHALKPGGKLLVLDLFQQEQPTFRDIWAIVVSKTFQLVRNRRLRESAEVRTAWEAHGSHDHYLLLSQVREICAKHLPNASVKQHLLWRYSIIWEKP